MSTASAPDSERHIEHLSPIHLLEGENTVQWHRSPFLRSVLAVAGGSAAGQAILVLASPLITRLYGPEIFGVWGVFSSIALVIAPAVALTYSTAIVLPKSTNAARALVRLSFWLTLITSAATFGVFFVFAWPIAEVLGVGTDAALFPLVGAYVFVIGVGAISQQWLIRTKKFRQLAISNVAFSGFTALAQVAGGLLSPTALMLIGSNIVGRALHSALLTAFARWWRGARTPHSLNHVEADESTNKVAREYRQFPIFRAPQVLVNGLSQALPILLLGVAFGPAAAGYYTLCRSVLGLPGQVIGNAVADVFYSRIAEASHKNAPLAPLVSRATGLLLAAVSIPFLTVIVLGPTLFEFVFGVGWHEAGEYAQWMSLWLWVLVANGPALQAIHVLRRQRFHLLFTLASTGLRLFAMGLAIALGADAIVATATFSVAGVVINIALIALVIQFCRKHDRTLESDGN